MKSVNYSFSSCVCANFMLLCYLGVEQGGQPVKRGALGRTESGGTQPSAG